MTHRSNASPHFIKSTDFYAAAARNRRNTLLLFALLISILVTLSYFLGWFFDPDKADPPTLFSIYALNASLIALAITAGMIFISIFWGSRIVMKISGGRELEAGEEQQLQNVVQEMSIAAGISPPKIFLIETEAMNAFATGMSTSKASVGITRGLLNRLTRDELQAVIAHEIGHIINYDIRYATSVAVIVGMIAMVEVVARQAILVHSIESRRSSYRRRSSQSDGGGAFLLLFILLLSILAKFSAVLIQMAISREREYLADATSVRLTRNPMGLINALSKLSHQNSPMESVSSATQHLYIVNPVKQMITRRGSRLMSTHPSLEERIERIKNLR